MGWGGWDFGGGGVVAWDFGGGGVVAWDGGGGEYT
jgi:hypothetical protein